MGKNLKVTPISFCQYTCQLKMKQAAVCVCVYVCMRVGMMGWREKKRDHILHTLMSAISKVFVTQRQEVSSLLSASVSLTSLCLRGKKKEAQHERVSLSLVTSAQTGLLKVTGIKQVIIAGFNRTCKKKQKNSNITTW